MSRNIHAAVIAAAALLPVNLALAAGPAPQVIHIDLTDASSDPAMKMMMITADAASAKAGPVSFAVTNKSKTTVHEMIVVAVADPKAALPYDAKKDQVVESKIRHLGEASDLAPGKTRTLKLTLKAGNYILICNQTGHYHQGMSTEFVVTK